MRSKQCLGRCAIISAACGIGGMILVVMSNNIFDMIIRQNVYLSQNSISRKMWMKTPKMKTSVYIFDIQNPEEIMQGAKPRLVEKGPFFYDEYHHKINSVWNSNGTVTYQNLREYHFNPADSNGSLDQNITIINVPSASISYTGKYLLKKPMRAYIDTFLNFIDEKLFVKKSVGEIIFEGYEDPLLSWTESLKDMLIDMELPFPVDTENDKFAIFYKRNMSTYIDGVFNLFTGRTDDQMANQMYAWNYTSQLPYFPDKCGRVSGNGGLFKPHLEEPKISLFSNDLCRPIIFDFVSSRAVKGVWGNLYSIGKMFLANSTINEDNWCYEAPLSYDNPKKDERLQFPSGVFNQGLCKFNSSAFVSQPHFYQADTFYLNQFVNGSLDPDQTKHETSMVIEPQSGIPLEMNIRFQVNVLIEPSEDIEMFKNFKNSIFMPAFWFECQMTLPDDLMFQMWALANLQTILLVTGYIVCTFHILVLTSIAIYFNVNIKKHNQHGIRNETKDYSSNDSITFGYISYTSIQTR